MRLPEQYLELFLKEQAETFHYFSQPKSVKTVCVCKKVRYLYNFEGLQKKYSSHDPVSSIYWWINRWIFNTVKLSVECKDWTAFLYLSRPSVSSYASQTSGLKRFIFAWKKVMPFFAEFIFLIKIMYRTFDFKFSLIQKKHFVHTIQVTMGVYFRSNKKMLEYYHINCFPLILQKQMLTKTTRHIKI